MEKCIIDSIQSCNEFLRTNQDFTNGKNYRVSHLYATGANSRWCYENLWGVYLAKTEYSWMALWMAVTSRAKIKKRQVEYNAPCVRGGDYIGSVSIFNPERLRIDDIFCKEAYLYVFGRDRLNSMPHMDISLVKRYGEEKEKALKVFGFRQETIERRNKTYTAWFHMLSFPLLARIDEWQVALLNVEKIIPSIEVTISSGLIKELSRRVKWLEKETDEDYIKY